ncbi:MAG: exodeoxyribonuclease VII small subunit [Candidatus Andersenbacteria bacterium]
MSAKPFNFTKGYEELEHIVADFESRELDLEKDIPKFERGLELAQKLQQRLKEIENKVVEIEKKFS